MYRGNMFRMTQPYQAQIKVWIRNTGLDDGRPLERVTWTISIITAPAGRSSALSLEKEDGHGIWISVTGGGDLKQSEDGL